MSDLLVYQAMVGDGVMALKDDVPGALTGPLMAGYWYEGPDFEAARAAEIEHVMRLINHALKRLSAGWMLHVVALRRVRHDYRRGEFAEPVDQAIDDERALYAGHYETRYALFLTQAPRLEDTSPMAKRLRRAFFGEEPREVLDALAERIARFEAELCELEHALSLPMTLRRMRSREQHDELLSAVMAVVQGRDKPCRLPANPVYLDVLIGRDLIATPEELVHDEEHIAVVGLLDLPAHSTPGLLLALSHLGVELCWSSRFIVMDYRRSRAELSALRRTWAQKTTSLVSQILGTNGPVDRDAVERTDEVDEALSDLEGGHVRFGHYTSTVLVRGRTQEEADERARVVVKALEERGFEARLEKVNKLEALLGSYPGHGVENVRKPVINTLNFADLMPLVREWSGEPECPSPYFPAHAPALMQVRSYSGARFHLNLHVGDVGHTLVLGPTGKGKSTLLAMLASQFLRYERAQVFVFDKGFSMLPLTLARQDGAHYALGAADGPALCPLAELDSPGDQVWSAEFIEALCEAAGLTLSPGQRAAIFEGVRELAATAVVAAQRTLTDFLPHAQDLAIREALRLYTQGAGARILNGESEALSYARLTTFELEELMSEAGGSARDRVLLPTLFYLFRQVEKRLDGRPTLLVIDEAWTQLGHARFAAKLREWLKTMRKHNCAVVMATQSLSDVVSSPIADTVFESCPTRILLPNEEATSDGLRTLYEGRLGLHAAQLEALAQAEGKRWYMLVQGSRSRLFSLDLGPVAMSFVGASGREERRRVLDLYAQHGEQWPAVWLRERGLSAQAAALEARDGRASWKA